MDLSFMHRSITGMEEEKTRNLAAKDRNIARAESLLEYKYNFCLIF